MNREQHKEKLDKILKHTKYDHRTKALWAYYRGKESVRLFAGANGFNSTERLILVNRHLNGSLNARHDWPCFLRKAREMVQCFNLTTVAHWAHAIRLIDIAKTPRGCSRNCRCEQCTVPRLR